MMEKEVAKAKQKAFDELYERTQRKEKEICISWQDREIELGRVCNKLGWLRTGKECTNK